MIRPITEQDAAAVLDLWNTCLPDFKLTKSLLQQNTFQSPYVLKEGSMVKEINGAIVGVVIAKAWHKTYGVALNEQHGWIQMLLVHPNYRRQHIGTALYTLAEQALIARGVKKIQIGGDIAHLLCGIPTSQQAGIEFAKKTGYKQLIESVDFIHYVDQNISLPMKENIEFVLLEDHEQDAFIAFIEQAFPGRWTFEARDYFAKGGTGRDYVVAKCRGKMIGFCRMNDEQSAWKGPNYNWASQFEALGGIGPLGITEEYRKHGLGQAIVEAAEYYLQQRGKKTLFIDWTDLIVFYEKLGYTIWQQYGIFVKQVK